MEKTKNKLRILVFCEFFYPHKNGVSEYIQNLSGNLMNKNLVEVTIVTYNNTNSKSQERYKGFKIIRVPCKSVLNGTYNFPVKGWKQISEKLKKENYDIVNTHTRFFTMSYLGYKFAKKNNIRFVHTEHGAMFVPHPNPIVKTCARIYDEILGRRVISKADLVCCISKAGVKFVKKLGAKKTKVISNGISKDYEKLSKTQLESLKKNFDSKKKNIVFVGRVVEAKGVRELITALSEIDYDYHFHLIGDGNYLKECKLLAKELKILKNITFYGSKDLTFIRNFLPLADIFVNPSYAEGLPTSVLEAGISGLNVIATDVGGTREIIINNKTGFLIRPKSKEQIRIALNKIKDKNYSTELRKHIEKNFLWENISNQYYELIKN
ncbi:MAG: glycosyltransferase family 4 protein [Candidatus Woesearchaeota archaeon]